MTFSGDRVPLVASKGYMWAEKAREGIWDAWQGGETSASKMLQKQNPFVVALCLPSGLGAHGPRML